MKKNSAGIEFILLGSDRQHTILSERAAEHKFSPRTPPNISQKPAKEGNDDTTTM